MGLRQSVTIAPGTMRTTPGGAATEPSAHVLVLSRRVTTYRIDVDAFQLIAGFDLLRTDESTVTFVSMRGGMDSCGNRMVCNGMSVDYHQ
jgi:hypothetical protein